jgi:putative ABC transport system permease protein
MKFVDDLWMALKGLNASKLRVSLTILGIIIGAAAIVSLVSVGRGTEASVKSWIEGIGTNLIFVTPGATTEGGIKGRLGTATTLTLEDAQAIASSPGVVVAPEAHTLSQARFQNRNVNTRIAGVTSEIAFVRNMKLKKGRFISSQDVELKSLVCALGSKVTDQLSAGADLVGKLVKIGDRHFEVIGILESKGGSGLGYEDDMILAPITTVTQRMAPRRTPTGGHVVSLINVHILDEDKMASEMDRISSLLRQRHRITQSQEDDFVITSMEEAQKALTGVSETFRWFLFAVALVALVVGGIGIMNVMMVSVTERTGEIGILRAVGARRRDILTQFLLEAMGISLVGAVVGILIGCGVSRLVSGVEIAGGTIETMVSLDAVFLALAATVTVGLFSGIYPAFRAARLNPVDALQRG